LEKVNIAHKLSLFQDYWQPKIIGEVNDSYVKLVKVLGEFVWHRHDIEDELFFIIKGSLLVKFRDKEILLDEGDLLIIPKGVEHLPIAEKEVHMLVFEVKTTLNTGNVQCEETVIELQHI